MPSLFPVPDVSRGRSPRTRAILYIVLLAAVVAIFYRLHEMRFARSDPDAWQHQAYEAADKAPDQPDPLAAVTPMPRFLGEIVEADLGQTDADAEAARNLHANSEAVRLSLAYLKGLSEETLRGKARENDHWTHTRVMEEPDRWRGRVLHFYGVVMMKQVEEFPDLPPGLRKLWKITLMDARQNNFYTILTPLLSEDVKVNTTVATDAVFLKRYPFRTQPDPARPPYWQWTPLLVAKRLYAKREPFPPPPLVSDPTEERFTLDRTVPELDPQKLSSIARAAKPGPPRADEEDEKTETERRIEALKVVGIGGHRPVQLEEEVRNLRAEKEAIQHLFRYVHHFSEAEAKARVDERMLFENIMRGRRPPDWALWQWVEVKARVAHVERRYMSNLESGIERVYVVVAQDDIYADPDYRWSFAALNLPHPLRKGDPILVRGVFVKYYPYVNKKNQYYWTPLVVARAIRKLPPQEMTAPTWAYPVVTVLILAAGAFVWWINSRDDQRRGQLREKLKERRAARDAIRAVKRQKQRDGGDAPAGSADSTGSGSPADSPDGSREPTEPGGDASGPAGGGTAAFPAGASAPGETAPPHNTPDPALPGEAEADRRPPPLPPRSGEGDADGDGDDADEGGDDGDPASGGGETGPSDGRWPR